MDILKRLRQFMLLSMVVSCPRSFCIPMSSISPCRRIEEGCLCNDCDVEGAKHSDFFLSFYFLIPQTPRLPQNLAASQTSGEEGKKTETGFLPVLILHRQSRGKVEEREGSTENDLTEEKTKCRSQSLAWSQLAP